MNNFLEQKQNINSRYLDVISKMENEAKVEEVRKSILEIASLLNALAQTSTIDQPKASQKASMLLRYAKMIREENSYLEIYHLLTGKYLKVSKKEEDLYPDIKEDKDYDSIKTKDEKNDEVMHTFNWKLVSDISFKDVAGLETVKEEIKNKIILPLTHPDLFEGYDKKNGGGLLLYGPPGTGKTMIGAAIANELNAKFCVITPSELLTRGVGESEKLVRQLFKEAREFGVSIIYFEEMESITPKSTHSQVSRQIRSELLTQIQGLSAYKNDNGKLLYLIASTNKPWDIDPAFIRPGRFGTRIYVDLPDEEARRYMVTSCLDKIRNKGLVEVRDINIDEIVERTAGYSGADVSYLLDEVQELSIKRSANTGEKYIDEIDFMDALVKVTSSIQDEDLKKLLTWKKENNL